MFPMALRHMWVFLFHGVKDYLASRYWLCGIMRRFPVKQSSATSVFRYILKNSESFFRVLPLWNRFSTLMCSHLKRLNSASARAAIPRSIFPVFDKFVG